jgi:CO/xanthine dehydrogenase Mo-binding subunit
VASAATDIGTGTGTGTVMTQLSADPLGLELEQVRFNLGNSDLPLAPTQGGSGLTAALGNALHAACLHLVRAFLAQAQTILAHHCAAARSTTSPSPTAGMPLLEETITDPGTGRIANATLGDYLVPVNADIPDID